ncbi:MAG: PAS domain-containing sensor histidine kinase [Opitutales bacterium]
MAPRSPPYSRFLKMQNADSKPVTHSWSLPKEVASAASRGIWCLWVYQTEKRPYQLHVADSEKWVEQGLPDIAGRSPEDSAQILLAHLPEKTQSEIVDTLEMTDEGETRVSNISLRIEATAYDLKIIKRSGSTYLYFRRNQQTSPIHQKSWDEIEDAYHFFHGLFNQSPNVIFLEDWSRLKERIDTVAKSGVTNFKSWANGLSDQEILKLFELVDILDVSQTATEMYKAESKQTVIENLDKILELSDLQKLRNEIGAIASGDKLFKDDFIFKDLEGNQIHGDVSVCVVEGYEDTWKYVIASVSEVTDRIEGAEELKRIARTFQESTDLFRGTLNHVQTPISLSDEAGIIIEANQSYCDFYGQVRDKIVGTQFLSHAAPLLTEADRERKMEQYSQFVRIGKSEEFEETVLTHKGWRTIDVVRGLYTRPDNQRWVVTSFFDITQLKSAEEQSRKLLQDERKLSELRSRFISMVSHEFRTPLTSAKMSSSVLIKYMDRLSEEMTVKHSEIIARAIRRLEDMIDGVLVISEAGAGKLAAKAKEIPLGEYLGNHIKEWHTAHPDIAFHTEFAPNSQDTIFADERLLYLAINNLVSNAVKYASKADPAVRITLKNTEQSGVLVTIADNGIGIPPEDQNEVFQSYYRASNVGKISGTGLGLVVVENSLKALGASISLKSEEGKGTTFLIDFPMTTKDSA